MMADGSDDSSPGSWELIAYYCAVVCAWSMTLLAVFGFAGYAYTRWFA
jgi:hypothetical protein